MNPREPITEQALQALQQRNEQRAHEAKEALGRRYLHHPANHVRRAPKRAKGALC